MSAASWDTFSDISTSNTRLGGNFGVTNLRMARDWCQNVGVAPEDEYVATPIVLRFLAEPLPTGWLRFMTNENDECGEGITYYANPRMGVTQWDHPRESDIIAQIAHVLSCAPRTGSKLMPYWQAHQMEQDTLAREISKPSRPIITDRRKILSTHSSTHQNQIRVPTLEGFPLVNLSAIRAFAQYFGVSDDSLPRIVWILVIAAVCPIPLPWSFKPVHDQVIYTRTEPSMSASKSHPFDPFFQLLIGHVLKQSTNPHPVDRLIPLDEDTTGRALFDWQSGGPVSRSQVACEAQTYLSTHFDSTSHNLADVSNTLISFREALQAAVPMLDVPCHLPILQSACSDIRTITLFPELLAILVEARTIRNLDRESRQALLRLADLIHESISTHADILTKYLRRLMCVMEQVEDISLCLRLARTLVGVLFVETTTTRTREIRLITHLLGRILRWTSQQPPDDSVDEVIVRMEESYGLRMNDSPTQIIRLSRILRNVSLDALHGPISPCSSITSIECDEDQTPRDFDPANAALVEAYAPGGYIVTRPVLQQLTRTELQQVLDLLEILTQGFNNRYVTPSCPDPRDPP